MRIWTRKSALIQPRTSPGKSDVSRPCVAPAGQDASAQADVHEVDEHLPVGGAGRLDEAHRFLEPALQQLTNALRVVGITFWQNLPKFCQILAKFS